MDNEKLHGTELTENEAKEASGGDDFEQCTYNRKYADIRCEQGGRYEDCDLCPRYTRFNKKINQ